MDNTENKKNISLKKIIIIIDVIVLLIAFIYFYSNYSKNKPDNHEKEPQTITYRFERFVFTTPSSISITAINEKQFKIEGNKWYAILEPYIDRENYIYKYPNTLYETIKNNGYNVTEPDKIMVDNYLVVVLNELDAKSVLCYLEYNDVIGYEIEIYNDDKSYDRTVLNEIVPILVNAELISDNGKPSPYDNIDYSEIIKETDNIIDEDITTE